ncbi:sensor histidine kinase [Altibacter sp. HG106]|uniref:sensor histidine kinase n=1 Tax=Altibacter sp. HG106 TaxID=3023937 RepID=UPI002350925F|nr:sensor histidine kinase [Altibacter sp. HG106]MDC7995100.1 sensor histidine kinase [Altibacter sp. HG106]
MKLMAVVQFVFFILLSSHGVAQEKPSLERQVQELSEKVQTTTGKEKLKWLDSLATITYGYSEFNFDSLAIATIKHSISIDSVDVGAYHVVNRMYNFTGRNSNPDSSKQIFESFKEQHISKVKKHRRIANFYKAGGLLYYNRNEYNTSLTYYDEALKAAKKTTDSQAIGEIYMGKGMVYYALGAILPSSQNLQKSIPYFRSTGSTSAIINVKNVMTSLYSSNGFYEQAEKERNEAIALAEEVSHHLFLSQLYFNQSAELRNRGKVEESLPYLEKALAAIEQSPYKNYYKPIYLAGMVSAQARAGNLTMTEKYWNLLKQEDLRTASGENQAYYLEAQMQRAFALGNFERASGLGESLRELRAETNNLEGLRDAEQFLSKTYRASGRYQEALEHNIRFHTLNDSLTNITKANALSYYQTLYETEKRDYKISAQNNRINLLDAKNQLKNQWLLFGGLGLLFVFSTIVALRSRHFAKRKQKMQQEFAQNVLLVQESERKHIAKELHDGLGQRLLLIKNTSLINPGKVPEMVDASIEEIRALSRNLHPVGLEKFGLTKAIVNMVDEVNEATEIFISEEVDNIDGKFPEEQEIYLYRIIQECLNNIIKHSHATASKVSVDDSEDKVIITVEDNGKGFQMDKGIKKAKSFGLQSLTERVDYLKGKIEFESFPEKGTKVIITLYK